MRLFLKINGLYKNGIRLDSSIFIGWVYIVVSFIGVVYLWCFLCICLYKNEVCRSFKKLSILKM